MRKCVRAIFHDPVVIPSARPPGRCCSFVMRQNVWHSRLPASLVFAREAQQSMDRGIAQSRILMDRDPDPTERKPAFGVASGLLRGSMKRPGDSRGGVDG